MADTRKTESAGKSGTEAGKAERTEKTRIINLNVAPSHHVQAKT